HEELAAVHRVGSILTIPLHSSGRVFGAITFERPKGESFDEAAVEMCDGVASVIGPVLEEKKRNDRWIGKKIGESVSTQLRRLFGPHYFGRKLAGVILLVLALFFSVFETDYRVTAPAILEGEVQRIIVAPFGGYLASQHARAGETVRQGQLLARLDDKDLTLERLRWVTTRRQHLTEYNKAVATHNRTEANIRRAQIDEANAQVELLDQQLARTEIKAPFDGILVRGDLTQSIGATVTLGQELFELAPLNAYRVTMEVDERDISEIKPGQQGVLRITSIPEQPFYYSVERITPIAEQAEGRNFYRVEGNLHESSERLRPGMEGVAKTSIERRLLIVAWTEKAIDWVRLLLWRWTP
ncbi:MAG: efflux RND transporter periplasmic adaptor subunit, partial [Gammaproteobacteria bacterium]|nr:efflux RND transporter periplasmic adaptor subunit [Gammaproteobacteria bacterium]